MTDILLFLTLMGCILLTLVVIAYLFTKEWIKLFITLFFLSCCIFTWIYFLKTDEQNALNKQDVIVAYGVVTSISDKTISIDGHKANISKTINEKYKLDYRKYDIGDVVEMKFLESVLTNYLISLEKIK